MSATPPTTLTPMMRGVWLPESEESVAPVVAEAAAADVVEAATTEVTTVV